MRIVTIPNILTVGRIVMIPVFVTAVVYDEIRLALMLFTAAAITDLLDGLLARMTNQKTPLGTFLDPLADKFLLVTSFLLFAFRAWIPKWLVIIVISRDLIVVVGWLLLYMIANTAKVEPLFLGKAAIASQLVTLASVLLHVSTGMFAAVHPYLFVLTAGLTVLSGLQYIARGLRMSHAGR